MWLAWTWQKIDKFLFEFRKKRGSQNTIKKDVIDDKEITEQTYILEHIREREFYETLSKTQEKKTKIEIENVSVVLIFQNALKIK